MKTNRPSERWWESPAEYTWVHNRRNSLVFSTMQVLLSSVMNGSVVTWNPSFIFMDSLIISFMSYAQLRTPCLMVPNTLCICFFYCIVNTNSTSRFCWHLEDLSVLTKLMQISNRRQYAIHLDHIIVLPSFSKYKYFKLKTYNLREVSVSEL